MTHVTGRIQSNSSPVHCSSLTTTRLAPLWSLPPPCCGCAVHHIGFGRWRCLCKVGFSDERTLKFCDPDPVLIF